MIVWQEMIFIRWKRMDHQSTQTAWSGATSIQIVEPLLSIIEDVSSRARPAGMRVQNITLQIFS